MPLKQPVLGPDSKTLYVSNYYGYKIQALDTRTFKPRWSTKTGHFPKMMALSADRKWLYVSSWESATVSKLHAATGKIQATTKVGRHPRGLSVSPDGKILYVAICGGKHVYMLDTARMKIIYKIRTGSCPDIPPSPKTANGSRSPLSVVPCSRSSTRPNAR